MSQDQAILIRVTAAIEAYNLGSLPLHHAAQVLREMVDHLETETDRRIECAVSALSYSEELAAAALLEALPDEGGLFVAGCIADRHGASRSVIVTTLSKLEAAGLIRTQSLGQKGSHIKFLIPDARLRILRVLRHDTGAPRATKPAI